MCVKKNKRKRNTVKGINKSTGIKKTFFKIKLKSIGKYEARREFYKREVREKKT